MSSEIALDMLSLADAADGMLLSEEAGWNQVAADWRVFLGQGRTFGIREPNGRLVATAATLPCGEVGVIAMVLVTETRRRRGLATDLVGRCIDDLRRRGLVQMLDATPAGREVYGRMGFRPLFEFDRWEVPEVVGANTPPISARLPSSLRGGPSRSEAEDRGGGPSVVPQRMDPHPARPAAESALPARGRVGALTGSGSTWNEVAQLDLIANGTDRAFLFADVGNRPDSRLVTEPGVFALIRRGRVAAQIGPVVAPSEPAALRLVAAAFDHSPGRTFVDVPSRWQALGAWLAGRGGTIQRSFTRMALGRATPFGDPARLFAVAGPEFG